MIGENRQLVTNEPVEAQDCRKITDHFRGIYGIYTNLVKETQRMSTCNRLDLQTLGSQPIMPKILPDHWSSPSFTDPVSMSLIAKGHFTHETEGPWPLHFKHSHMVEKVEPVQLCFTLHLRDQWSKLMQVGCNI
jgi:hypothetical protein